MTRRIRVLRSIAGALALVLAWSGPAPGQVPNFVSLSDAENRRGFASWMPPDSGRLTS